MILLIYLTICTLGVPTIAVPQNFTQDIETYVNLISDVQKYYKTRSICIVYNNSEDLLVTTKLLTIVKFLSKDQHYSQAITQLNFNSNYNKSFLPFTRQLFVLPLTSEKLLINFENFTNTHEVSYHIWLLIFSKLSMKMPRNFCRESKIDRLNLNIDTRMLVKCHGNPVIRELYSSRANGDVEVYEQFAWYPQVGFMRLNSQRLFERRHDFHGRVVRIASVEIPNSLSTTKNNSQSYEFIKKVMEELSIYLNFTIKRMPPANAYGLWNKTEKKWTGILGKLASNEIDVAVTELIMTPERRAEFDFSWPLIVSQNRLYVKKPDSGDVQWNIYIKAFNVRVWASIGLLIIIAPIFLTFIKVQIRGMPYLKNLVMENYLYVWGIYCQQGLPDYTESSVLKIAYFSIFLSAIIVSWVYSASLISYLTIATPTVPFKSVPEFIRDGSYKLIVIRDSAEHEMFMSGEKIIHKGVIRLLKRDDELPSNYFQGFNQVCDEKVGFYASEAMQQQINDQIPCELSSIPAGLVRFMAIGLQKNSPLTNFLKYYIRRNEENGVVKRIKNKYKKIQTPVETTYDPVELWKIAPVCAILIFGSIISTVILLLERKYYELRHIHNRIFVISVNKNENENF